INRKAAIYVQKTAFGDYFHGERYIGVKKEIAAMPGIEMLEGDRKIDEELSLFTGITGRRYWPQSNLGLSEMTEGQKIQDEFRHEQCLVIQGEKNLLLSGCAHNGILNILDSYQERYDGLPDIVISGFHMMKKTDYTVQEAEIIRQTAAELAGKDILFYTGHCTGPKALEIMHPILKEKLIPIHCGMEIYL
ncbi:MAG: MBL fold metallo-hydrolase, partial [Lachnospiraceae bacterium]|nr:MBL fold metallo-hydrolase [Lachnospiraceae bacterium]